MNDDQDLTKRRTSIGAQRNPASQEAILQAAAEILAEHGPKSFSIEAVAKRAKAGKPTIYRWWPNKAALLLDTYHRQKNPHLHADSGDLQRDLTWFLTELLAFWRRGGSGAIFRSVIAEAQTDQAACEALGAYLAERRKHLGAQIRATQARENIGAEVNPELVAEMLSGFAWIRLLTNRLEIDEEEAGKVVKTILDGIRGRG
ncbi:TetR family transcriptional regulator [Ciceribacter lividus]|uniref:TetR family transcriptional regulator n=1 Tax=Ciceribacter lividus TaxID=1197950 RepID=A0A6I7HMU7_9HYPH|nr:TetR/AcrR family transcriptional regulator [Ciceribacter lividus]RCW23391.1 TetR family transcriptional regulator [Ciceribacter lividus]